MKKHISLLLVIIIGLVSIFTLAGCQPQATSTNENQPTKTIVELNENNYWKYINVSNSTSYGDKKPSVSYEINGILDYALYEDVVFTFDVIYYADGQSDDQYQSYTMRVACNAAGDAAFETTYLGITNVTIGKYLGIDGELVSFENYNFKIYVKSISGKVIYTV